MTTATRPLPAHGERARYLRGCRCDKCGNANYRYMSRLRLDHDRGRPRRIPSGPVSDHVQALSQAGWSLGQIAATAGCGHRTIRDILNRTNPTTRADVAARILATRVTISTVPSGSHIDATGTVRRVRALMAIGHTLLSVAKEIDMAPTALCNVLGGKHPTVTVATARAIADVYRRWSMHPGTSQRVRNLAARRGWHSPFAWDEHSIDDPQAQPETCTATAYISRGELAEIRKADVWHLADYGYTADQITARLGDEISLSHVRELLAERRTGTKRPRATAA